MIPHVTPFLPYHTLWHPQDCGLGPSIEYRPTTKHSRLMENSTLHSIDMECFFLPLVNAPVCSVGLVMNKSKHGNE